MYSNDRDLKNTIRNTKKYKSRRELRNDHKVMSTVNRWRSGLGEEIQEEAQEESDELIQDKYYVPDHFPPRDIATEMAGYAGLGKGNFLKYSLMAIAGLIVFKLVIAK